MNGAWRVFTPTPVAFAGRVSQWGLAVSRSFGDLPLKDPMKLLSVVPETKVIELDEDCLEVVLACDGTHSLILFISICLLYQKLYKSFL